MRKSLRIILRQAGRTGAPYQQHLPLKACGSITLFACAGCGKQWRAGGTFWHQRRESVRGCRLSSERRERRARASRLASCAICVIRGAMFAFGWTQVRRQHRLAGLTLA